MTQIYDTYNGKTAADDGTICALATQAGGAIGVIRVSGGRAIAITDSIFRGNRLADTPAQTVRYGNIVDTDGQTVDDVLVTVFRAPHSYTGEDSTEISCHGSRYILNKVLQLLVGAGCRIAEPGEYTRRAFLNGKMDLSQAEAVADLIASTNAATHRIAMGQLRGNISTELARLRERLLHLTSLMELELDFSDHEELEFADRGELLALARAISGHITRLTSTFASGQAIKKGIPVAIVGKTNVGKSTLLNLLVGEEKAIVSDIHGTTRDVIEDTADIGGVTFRFIDTAGMRATDDEIERIGIERTYRKLDDATIVMWLTDALPSHEEFVEMIKRCNGKKLIIVNNKTDIADLTPQLSDMLYAFFAKGPAERNVAEKDGIISASADGVIASAQDNIIAASDSVIAASDSVIAASDGIITSSTDGMSADNIAITGISAREDINTEALRRILHRFAGLPDIGENDVILTSARHYDSLLRANESIARVIDGLGIGLSGDLLSEDLRLCLDQLAEITGGQITTNEVLGNIFKHFCIGK